MSSFESYLRVYSTGLQILVNNWSPYYWLLETLCISSSCKLSNRVVCLWWNNYKVLTKEYCWAVVRIFYNFGRTGKFDSVSIFFFYFLISLRILPTSMPLQTPQIPPLWNLSVLQMSNVESIFLFDFSACWAASPSVYVCLILPPNLRRKILIVSLYLLLAVIFFLFLFHPDRNFSQCQ